MINSLLIKITHISFIAVLLGNVSVLGQPNASVFGEVFDALSERPIMAFLFLYGVEPEWAKIS